MSAEKKSKTAKGPAGPVGVVVAAHEDYGAALLSAARLILGGDLPAASVGVDAARPVEETVEALKAAVLSVDRGAGVLIVTDMFGGTPTNLALSLLGSGAVDVITGVNLPMLLKVLGSREVDLRAAALAAQEAGVKGIVAAGALLKGRSRDKKDKG